MKPLITALAFSLFAAGASMAEVRKENSVEADVNRAAKTAVATYKEGCVSGLVIGVQDCWDKSQKTYCLYLDWASKHVDDKMSASIGAPSNAFFSVNATAQRAFASLAKVNRTDDAKSAYITDVESVANQATDNQLLKSLRR